MLVAFYLAGAVAILSTLLAITRVEPVHALLYLVVSLLAVAVVFFLLGAPFVAALEVVVYAGAIMVLFVFVVMMLNLGAQAKEAERRLVPPRVWIGPALLGAVLVALLVVPSLSMRGAAGAAVGPVEVGRSLFGPYAVAVELASLLLLGALVGANHLGFRPRVEREVRDVAHSGESRALAGGAAVRAGDGGAAHPP